MYGGVPAGETQRPKYIPTKRITYQSRNSFSISLLRGRTERLPEVVVVVRAGGEAKVSHLHVGIRVLRRQQQILRLRVRQRKITSFHQFESSFASVGLFYSTSNSISLQSQYLDVTMGESALVHVLQAQQGVFEHRRGVFLRVLLQFNDAIKQLATGNPASENQMQTRFALILKHTARERRKNRRVRRKSPRS